MTQTLRTTMPLLAVAASLFASAPAMANSDGPGRMACAKAQRAINSAEWHLERVTDQQDITFWKGVLFTNLNYRNTYCNF